MAEENLGKQLLLLRKIDGNHGGVGASDKDSNVDREITSVLMFSIFIAVCSSFAGGCSHGWLTFYSPYLAFIGISLFSASYPIGMGGIPYVIMSEIFPINIKGTAGSLAIIVGYLSDLIVSYSFNFMMAWSSSGTFFMFTSINLFSLFFIAKVVPETKGRTLEEIQVLLTQILH